jgi:hypothetical protein
LSGLELAVPMSSGMRVLPPRVTRNIFRFSVCAPGKPACCLAGLRIDHDGIIGREVEFAADQVVRCQMVMQGVPGPD